MGVLTNHQMNSSNAAQINRSLKNSPTSGGYTSASKLDPARSKTAAKMQATRKLRIQTARSPSRNAWLISARFCDWKSDIFRLSDFGKNIHARRLRKNPGLFFRHVFWKYRAHLFGGAIDQMPVNDVFHPADGRMIGVDVGDQNQSAGRGQFVKTLREFFADGVGQIIKQPCAIDKIKTAAFELRTVLQ